MNENERLYELVPREILQDIHEITIDTDCGFIYIGPENGIYSDEVMEIPESVTTEIGTFPVVGFMGGRIYDASSVTEVILPSSILFLEMGFTNFTNLRKVTCYAESAPRLESERGAPQGMDFEGTPDSKELYIPSGSDYSTWTNDTTWASVNEIYDGFVENGLKYKETSETTVALIGYDETFNQTSITIPSSITHEGKTYTVTEIKNAFKNYTGLTSVTIPNSVTSIGDFAFNHCSSLTAVTIPNSVTKISETAFSNVNLEETETISVNNISLNVISIDTRLDKFLLRNTSGITFTYGNITESSTVYGCECLGLTDATIPTPTLDLTNLIYNDYQLSIYTIKANSFQNNTSIITAILPDSVTSIGNHAFRNCSSLTSVDIPNSVTSIGKCAFYDCSSLTSVNIPNSVTSIGNDAFSFCSSLTSVTIPNSVTAIGEWVFYGCSSLTSVTIPNSVTSIGGAAFYNCSGLTSITIGNSVTRIGGNAFWNCSSLNSVYLLNPTGKPGGNRMFEGTPETKVLIVPAGATGYSTSWADTTWAAVNYDMILSDGINYKLNDINTIETFSSNNKSETLTIPSTVTYNDNTYSVNKVSRNSLANDNKMKTLTIESGINKIEASALSGCNNLETVNIPESVTEIDNHAFWMCKNLKNIVLPSTLTKLKPEMFVACEELQTITIPNGITKIPFRMFEGCKNLTTVNLPSTITEIQWSAFKDCKNLTTINIPSGCTVDSTAFEGTNITV